LHNSLYSLHHDERPERRCGQRLVIVKYPTHRPSLSRLSLFLRSSLSLPPSSTRAHVNSPVTVDRWALNSPLHRPRLLDFLPLASHSFIIPSVGYTHLRISVGIDIKSFLTERKREDPDLKRRIIEPVCPLRRLAPEDFLIF